MVHQVGTADAAFKRARTRALAWVLVVLVVLSAAIGLGAAVSNRPELLGEQSDPSEYGVGDAVPATFGTVRVTDVATVGGVTHRALAGATHGAKSNVDGAHATVQATLRVSNTSAHRSTLRVDQFLLRVTQRREDDLPAAGRWQPARHGPLREHRYGGSSRLHDPAQWRPTGARSHPGRPVRPRGHRPRKGSVRRARSRGPPTLRLGLHRGAERPLGRPRGRLLPWGPDPGVHRGRHVGPPAWATNGRAGRRSGAGRHTPWLRPSPPWLPWSTCAVTGRRSPCTGRAAGCRPHTFGQLLRRRATTVAPSNPNGQP